MTAKSWPRGSSTSESAARSRRRARLRTTAPPSFRLAITASAALASSPRARDRSTIKRPCAAAPSRSTLPTSRGAGTRRFRRAPSPGAAGGSSGRDTATAVIRSPWESRSGGEALAALGTPGLHDRLACTVLHAAAKTVLPLPAPVVRLVGTLHRLLTPDCCNRPPAPSWCGRPLRAVVGPGGPRAALAGSAGIRAVVIVPCSAYAGRLVPIVRQRPKEECRNLLLRVSNDCAARRPVVPRLQSATGDGSPHGSERHL
jgi:hypothetical protein